MQLNRKAKLPSTIGLTTKHAVIANHFIMGNYFNELRWSEALLVAHTTLLDISCHGSLMNVYDFTNFVIQDHRQKIPTDDVVL